MIAQKHGIENPQRKFYLFVIFLLQPGNTIGYLSEVKLL